MSELNRRQFTGASAAAIVGLFAAHRDAGAQETEAPPLKSEFLFEMEAGLETPLNIGQVPDGGRQIFYVKDGWVRGPKITATVLPGGGDWFRMRSDGVGMLNVRGVMKTDDGALIYVTYKGMVHGDYFRIQPWFETASETYAWLNKLLAVGVRKPTEQGKVGYNVYAIL